jgi:tetratricopeptide (TPR) repeat protein
MLGSMEDRPAGNGSSIRQVPAAYLAALRDDPQLSHLAQHFVSAAVTPSRGADDAVAAVIRADRLVLLGPPGSGKTWTLRMALRRLATGAAERVPVYLDLADTREGEGVEELAARVLAGLGAPGATLQSIAPAVLLLDHLDRATDVYLLEGLELLLRAGGRVGPAVVLACREADWPAYRSWFGDLPTAALQPLTAAAVAEALSRGLPPATAAAAERWLAEDPALSRAVRSPSALAAFLDTVGAGSPDGWRRSEVLAALLETRLAGVPVPLRPAYRAAFADIALGNLGRGPLVEVDTVAMGLGATRDDMIRTGVVVARGAALEFVEPLVARHCAATALLERAAADPGRLARQLGDLTDPRRLETLVHVFGLAPDPVDFLVAMLPLDGGPEVVVRCLSEPGGAGGTAPPAGDVPPPDGAARLVAGICAAVPPVPALQLYRLGEALARSGQVHAAEIALQATLGRLEDSAACPPGADAFLVPPDGDAAPPLAEWCSEYQRERNRGLVLRAVADDEASATALAAAGRALERLEAELGFERGLAAGRRGDWAAALAAFEAAQAVEPDRVRYLVHYGLALIALDRAAEAVRFLQRACERLPERAPLLAAIGQALWAQEAGAEALASYEAARALAPHEPSFDAAIGELEAELGGLEAAAAALGRAVAARPRQAGWQDALGQVLAELGRWDAAALAFRQAVEQQPGEPGHLIRLGQAQAWAGDGPAAASSLRRALELAPQSALAHAELGRALAQAGEIVPAIQALRRATALDNGWPADHLLLAQLLRQHGAPDEALAHALQAVELAPASALAQVELGRVQETRGEDAAALAAYERAAELAPGLAAAGDAAAIVRRRRTAPAPAEESPADRMARLEAEHAAGAVDLAALARAYEVAGREQEALATYAEAASGAVDLELLLAWSRLARQVGEPDVAIEAARRAAALQPDHAAVYVGLGQAYEAAGLLEAALAAVRRAASLSPEEPALRRTQARLSHELGRADEAIAALEEGLSDCPNAAELHYELGRAFEVQGLASAAQAAFTRAAMLAPENPAYLRAAALAVAPQAPADAMGTLLAATAVAAEDAEAHYQLGRLQAELGQEEAALSSFERAAALAPGEATYQRALGDCLVRLGRPEAEAVLRLAVTLAPEEASHHAALAAVDAAQGRTPAALDGYAMATRLAPEVAAHWRALGLLRLKRSDVAGAEEALAEAVRLDPQDAVAQEALARARRPAVDAPPTDAPRGGPPPDALTEGRNALAAGDYPAAQRAFNAAVEQWPGDARLHYLLGLTATGMGQPEAALGYLETAARLDDTMAETYLALGELHASQGNLDEAIQAFEQALACDPEAVEPYLHLGVVCREAGLEEKAVAYLTRATTLAPADYRAWHRLGQVHAAAGELDGAIAAYDAALERAPEVAEVCFDAGLAYKQRRDYGRASELFRTAVRLSPKHTAAYTQLAAVSALHFLDRATPGDGEGAHG